MRGLPPSRPNRQGTPSLVARAREVPAINRAENAALVLAAALHVREREAALACLSARLEA